MRTITYRPLYANHPATANNISILPNGSQRICRIDVPQPKAICNLCVCIRFSALADAPEVFYRDAVFVWWEAEDNNLQGLRGSG